MTHRRRPSSATASDPVAPPPSDGSRLGGPADTSRRGEHATVISYQSDRYTATVRTERGRTMSGVPRLRSTPGEIAALTQGTEVLLSYDYGMPIILGVLNMPASGNDASETTPATEITGFGGDGANRGQITSHGNYRGATEPRDIIPGDYIQTSAEGAMFGLLSGGVALMKASSLAQVRAHMLTDLVEIISRNFRHVTDMGEFTITNNDGRINMRFRGASDQRSEAGVDEERWTILMDLGSEGDLFNFELCTTEGQTLFRFHVDSSGHCEIFGVNGVTTASGSRASGTHAEEHSGDSTRRVGGSRSTTTAGDATHSVGGSVAVTAMANQSIAAGNDLQLQAVRDVALSAGRNMAISAQGGDGDTALLASVTGGNAVVEMGSADDLSPAFKVNTRSGGMYFKSTNGGPVEIQTELAGIKATAQTIKLITNQPDSVVLGGDTLASHLAKYEELKQILLTLFTNLDTHTHPESIGGGVTSAPLVPIGATLIGSLESIKSLKAGVSG
jgi:hypothetical protein